MSEEHGPNDEPLVRKSSFVDCRDNGELSNRSTPNKQNRSRLPVGAMTDPNSIYRKLYNRNLEFFLWVIATEPAPFFFKLHVQALTKTEMKPSMVKRSVQALVPNATGKGRCQPKI